jgi:hypothetical protein
VASVIGWLVLVFGLSMALGLGLLFYAIWTVAVALAIALPTALVALVVGTVLVTGGRSLRRSGADAERTTREQALLALAAHRGAVTAADAARALGVSIADADAMLTTLAKHDPEHVAVDVDEQGVVWYRAVRALGGEVDAHVRVAEGPRAEEPGTEAEIEDEARRAELRR